MTEPTFNLFLFISDEVITGIGATVRKQSGTDTEKLRCLQDSVADDCRVCKRYQVPARYVMVRDGRAHQRRIGYVAFKQLASIGRQIEFFEEVFQDLGAPQNPLMVVTPVVDGHPRIDDVTDLA